MMSDKIKEMCNRNFSTHKAELIQNTDRYLIIDWRRADGSSDHYVNYIVDKERGSLIVSGDLGDSIAVWYNPVDPANLKCYIRDIRYYMQKIQCATDLYVYDKDDAVEEIREYLDKEDVQSFIEADTDYDFDNSDDFWEYVEDEVSERIDRNGFRPSDDMYPIVSGASTLVRLW
ncbi:MAG: hypothetical protein NC489_43990 [Ruminococcus flavefaciens]|nr:hypothetical protein [Ruminococcus flavefaciens]